METEKPLPAGVLKRLTWTCVKSEIAPVIEQHICEILLRAEYIELIISYDFASIDTKEDVPKRDIVRVNKIIPKAGIGINRTVWSHDLEERQSPDELPPLYHAIVFDFYGQEYWLYMSNSEAGKIFSELKKWLLNT